MSLVELSLKRPITAIMFYVSMVAIGLIASVRLPLEQFPDVNFPFMMVSIPYPGSTPQEVRTQHHASRRRNPGNFAGHQADEFHQSCRWCRNSNPVFRF